MKLTDPYSIFIILVLLIYLTSKFSFIDNSKNSSEEISLEKPPLPKRHLTNFSNSWERSKLNKIQKHSIVDINSDGQVNTSHSSSKQQVRRAYENHKFKNK